MPYCTYAVSGPLPVFQAIYVCRTCSEGGDCGELLCVCQACADTCHGNHEGLEYIGIGPSYCDCQQIGQGCGIKEASRVEAQRRGVLFDTASASNKKTKKGPLASVAKSQISYISALERGATSRILQGQARELIKHSKETFWLDSTAMTDREADHCDLERLASRIWERHVEAFELDRAGCGAEWWVQVKPVQPRQCVDLPSFMLPESSQSNKGAEAIDLHYDKDEDLAEAFGIGAFPVLSTVTYLTDSDHAPPTVIFSRCYEDPPDEEIQDMLVNYPRRGKHLVFDGRLLHGAPAHSAFRRGEKTTASPPTEESDEYRITFLVNVWERHKPAGVEPLPEEIRNSLQRSLCHLDGAHHSFLKEHSFEEAPPFERTRLVSEGGLPPDRRCRIELPFVVKSATWGSDSGETATILTTFPPTADLSESDCFLVTFGPGLGACLDYQADYSEEEDL